jgi:hypothetical protein
MFHMPLIDNFSMFVTTSWIISQVPTQSTGANPLVLFAAAVAWSALWCQLLVIPFYGKGEKLHQDYHSSGKLNSVLAAIEASRLIPALASMFNRALDEQSDKRKRPNMEELLQAVQFLPDLEAAQGAMSTIENLRGRYESLRLRANRLWKWGLAHSIATPLLPAVYVYLLPFSDWLLWLLGAVTGFWVVTLGFSIIGMVRFHDIMSVFNKDLEVHGGAVE